MQKNFDTSEDLIEDLVDQLMKRYRCVLRSSLATIDDMADLEEAVDSELPQVREALLKRVRKLISKRQKNSFVNRIKNSFDRPIILSYGSGSFKRLLPNRSDVEGNFASNYRYKIYISDWTLERR